jgi:hypothetical protein
MILEDIAAKLLHNARHAHDPATAGKTAEQLAAEKQAADEAAAKKAADDAAAKAAAAKKAPLADFADIWTIDAATQPKNLSDAVKFTFDPAKLAEAAKTVDFAKNADPELIKKALAGDAASLQALLNGTGQSVYLHSAVATSKLVEAALSKQAEAITAALPDLVKKQQITEDLRSGEDAAFYTNPAVSPVVSLMEHQLRVQNPDLTAKQIATKAREFVAGIVEAKTAAGTAAAVAAAGRRPDGATRGARNDNWETFFKLPAAS